MDNGWVFLVGKDGEKIFKKIEGDRIHTHKGFIQVDDLKGKGKGSVVRTNKGYPFIISSPTIDDFILHLAKRKTQVVYPKDAGYIVMKLSPFPGAKVLEGGTGSGVMASIFAWFVGSNGKVYSFEKRRDFVDLARENLRILGLEDRVEIIEGDLSNNLDIELVDMVFLDVKEPWLVIENVFKYLKDSSPFSILVPTFNQVKKTLDALKDLPVFDLNVVEILERFYKVNPERLRPVDRMVAHTGFLIFGRKGS